MNIFLPPHGLYLLYHVPGYADYLNEQGVNYRDGMFHSGADQHSKGGGTKSTELGTCPAYPEYGQQCGRVAGTLWGGEVQCTFAKKLGNCQKCEFYTSKYYDKSYSRGLKDPLKKAVFQFFT